MKYHGLGYLREYAITKEKLDRSVAAKLLGINSLAGSMLITGSKFLFDVGPGSPIRQPEEAASWQQMAIECFGGPPCGVVVQKGVTVYAPKGFSGIAAKHGEYVNAWIARGKGTQFTDYSIGSLPASPTGMEEAVGGISFAIWDWQDAYLRPGHGSGNDSNQWVFWGLVELRPAQGDDWLTGTERKSMDGAIKAYQQANAAKGQLTGLTFGLFGLADAQLLRNRMLGIGVKEAVCLDTSDSAMFGGGTKVLWGDGMVAEKRVAQNFGIAFFPI